MKVTEGQLDFLGLINEYKDSQGAVIRVKEPGKAPKKPNVDSMGATVKSVEGEQLKLDLEAIKPPVTHTEVKTIDTGKPDIVIREVREPETFVKAEPVKKPEIIGSQEQVKKAEITEKSQPVNVPEKIEKHETVKKTEITEKSKPLKTETVRTTELPTKERKSDTREVKEAKETKEILFKQCKRCWCFDCKHNSRNEAVPREMCGSMMPCPACDGCVAEDQATICEIGNAKEGCKLRATEEGIYTEENFNEA